MYCVDLRSKSQTRGKPLISKGAGGAYLSKIHYLFGKEYLRKLRIGKCSHGVINEGSGQAAAFAALLCRIGG